MMIVGEAPGKEEDSRREPFTGPAGRLMDKIWESVELNTESWYITNVVKCRPYMPKGSGRENFTPRQEQRKLCYRYLTQEFELLDPAIIVPLGGVATAALLGESSVKMGEMRGKLLTVKGKMVFPMYHPAAILHAQRNPDLHQKYRQDTWKDIQELKKILQKEGLV